MVSKVASNVSIPSLPSHDMAHGSIWAQIGEMTANGYKPIANISRDDEEEIFISVFDAGYMESVQKANVIAQYRIEEVTE